MAFSQNETSDFSQKSDVWKQEERMEIPARLAGTVVDLHGARGEAWLVELPRLVGELAERWGLVVEPPFAELSYNYVAPAVRGDGQAVVLKMGVPNRELDAEIAALRHYGGRGAVRLLAADATAGALLLERLVPGTMLVEERDDEKATAIAAEVMAALWQPAPDGHDFPTVADWARGLERLRATFDGGTGPFPERLLALAEGLFAELLASEEAPVLLHGDLHHYNILRAERAPWLAIDPKGVVGERGFEVYAWLHNPLEKDDPGDLRRLLARRLDILAERLGLERQRLAAWGLAGHVLSDWWDYEERSGSGQRQLGLAAALVAHL
jgi:streptomycin 6-kinase